MSKQQICTYGTALLSSKQKKKQQQQKSMKVHSSWQTLSANKSLTSILAFGSQKELERFYHPCFIASELTRKNTHDNMW